MEGVYSRHTKKTDAYGSSQSTKHNFDFLFL
jgi:hypothetical protein